VLISPVIAAIPAKNPERAMSALHSIYAWGVVFAILLSTLFITLVGDEHWQIMIFAFCIIPLISAVLFLVSEIPDMQTPERISGALAFFKNKNLWLCVFAIFLGGAAECTMAQWASGYIEKSLGISKLWGDVFGVALFGLMLGIGRSTYAKIGKNIEKVLFLGAIGAFCCYIISVFTPIPIIGLFACGFTGFCVSMLWPGSLIAATDRIPDGGVFIYAMMAAGGDLGASVVPQLVGIITDTVSASEIGRSMAESLSMSAEQLGMKAAMLCGSIFPFIGIFLYLYLLRQKRRMNAGD
jgi:fucose permease